MYEVPDMIVKERFDKMKKLVLFGVKRNINLEAK